MWLDNLKELKKKSGMSSKQIAEGTLLPERTICRIFNGETTNPTITTLIPIIKFLGGSMSEIFADTKAIIGDETLAHLQEDKDVISAERDALITENKILAEKVNVLSKELELTNLKLMYTEKLLATHDFYNKLKPNE